VYSVLSDSKRSANANANGSAQFSGAYVFFHATHFSPLVYHHHMDLWRYSHLTQGRPHLLYNKWYVSDHRWVAAVACLTSPMWGRSNKTLHDFEVRQSKIYPRYSQISSSSCLTQTGKGYSSPSLMIMKFSWFYWGSWKHPEIPLHNRKLSN
jgi:hypothetical protein